MPFKTIRNETDSISRDNCTYYWPSNSDNKWPEYPGYEKPYYGVTGLISGCGEQNKCPPGFKKIGDGVNGDYAKQKNNKIVAKGLAHIIGVIGAGNVENNWKPNEIKNISGANSTQCGNVCKQRNTKADENDCGCRLAKSDRNLCIRTEPYKGDWKKCCLESDANKLVNMDCAPEYFATNDGSEKVSLKCKEEIDSFCKKEPAYNKDNKEAPINSEYLELCGCNYPDEYYTSIRDEITKDFPKVTGAELGNIGCFAPTCVIGASDFVKPVMKNNCPTNNFLSCINTINLDVGGDIKGEIEINQSNECNVFQEDGTGDNEAPKDPGTKDDKKNKKDESQESFEEQFTDFKLEIFNQYEIEDNDTNNSIMWSLLIGSPICCLILFGLVLLYFL